MEDLSTVSLQHLAQYWPAELRAKLGGLSVASVGDFLALSPLDVITAPGSDRDVLSSVKLEIRDWIECTERYTGVTEDDVDRFLARPGFSRPLAAARDAPATSWGCLYTHWVAPEDEVWISDRGKREISAALEAVYLERGLVVSHAPPEGGLEQALDPSLALDARVPRAGEPLANDVVLVDYHSDCADWYSVHTRRWWLSPPGRNPLAISLSARFPVIAIAGVAERYTELAIYRGGALERISVRGAAAPTDLPEAAPFDADALRWLSALCDDFPVPPGVLASRLCDAGALASGIGLDARGYAATLRAFLSGDGHASLATHYAKPHQFFCVTPSAPA